jgi:arsenate reductase
MTRMNIFVSLPLHMLEKNAAQREISAIGEPPM